MLSYKMVEKTWLDYFTAIGSIATPVLVIALTAVGWAIKTRLQRQIELENQLRSDRITIYKDILEPFIILLSSEDAWKSEKKNKNLDKNKTGLKLLISLEYRRTAFHFSLIGSDDVVKAYNNLRQYYYAQIDSSTTDTATTVKSSNPKEQLELLGALLLEIRRSMGNEFTELSNWDMLEWLISDVRELRDSN